MTSRRLWDLDTVSGHSVLSVQLLTKGKNRTDWVIITVAVHSRPSHSLLLSLTDLNSMGLAATTCCL